MEANEYAALPDPSHSVNTDTLFTPLLDQELKKIIRFYENQEKELLDEVADLEERATQLEEAGLAAGERYLDDDDDDDDEDDDESISRSPERKRRRSVSFQRRAERARCELHTSMPSSRTLIAYHSRNNQHHFRRTSPPVEYILRGQQHGQRRWQHKQAAWGCEPACE